MGDIKDKVAIIGIGCTKFGELWDKGIDDLIIDSTYEALDDAGIGLDQCEAAVMGTLSSGLLTAAPLAEALAFDNKPVSRVENNCASGADALRYAAFSVASGMYDIVLAVGVEKSKDMGSGSLEAVGTLHPVTTIGSAPAAFGKAAVRYCEQYGLSREQLKRTLAKIAVKGHYNGSLHPKAHFRKPIVLEAAVQAPLVAWPLGLFDCCPVTDGAAAAIVCRADMAKKFGEHVIIKAIGLATGRIDPCKGKYYEDRDITFFQESYTAAQQAYDQMGIKNPRKEISTANIHDCFTITEFLLYETLGFSPVGNAKPDVDAGNFTLKGDLPVNTDGGLKAFGHPVGASGIRMIYECYNQLLGRAGPRQIKDPKIGMQLSQGGMAGHGMQSLCTLVVAGQ
jgi:acetyl-CoA C-acetyltransferase